MLVDGGNVEDGPDIIKFLKSKNIKTLDVVVATHAHEDHIGGLGAIIDNFTVNKIYCPQNEYNSLCFDEFKDAANRQSGITLCKQGDSWPVGEAKVNVLWPVNAENEETNNTSIVFTLKFENVTFLFTGDAEQKVETKIINSNYDIKADVLKVGHHGANTSSSYYFVREVMPSYAIISCGNDNVYGHPHEETVSRYLQARSIVLRTDKEGTISVFTDGTTINVNYGEGQLQTNAVTPTPSLEQTKYIGNKNSKKFHLKDCSSLPKENNSVRFKTREDAVNEGYIPCGICKP